MATNETVAKEAPLDPLAADPNVRVPDSVKEAASAADKLHEQFYPKNPEQPAAPNKEDVQQPSQPEPVRPDAAAQVQDPPQPVAQEQHPEPTAAEKDITAEEWRHRFLSMQGRYNSQVRQNASMEEQMRQLGQELVRTQALVGQQQPATQQPPSSHEQLITEEDRANYGDELIDLTRRAAREAVSPELEQLRRDNAKLNQQVSVSSKRELFQSMDQHLPNWRVINKDVRFLAWLRLPNIYTGQIRGNMLKEAVNGAEAPKVLQLFKDFLTEAAATGQTVPAAQTEQRPAAATQQQPSPHAPAVDLATLAAPGRARPASGDGQVPTEKPIYSRADISKFFDEKRRGLWAHRLADAQAVENDLTAAQREGRIRG